MAGEEGKREQGRRVSRRAGEGSGGLESWRAQEKEMD
jgi:hypothetical protein